MLLIIFVLEESSSPTVSHHLCPVQKWLKSTIQIQRSRNVKMTELDKPQ